MQRRAIPGPSIVVPLTIAVVAIGGVGADRAQAVSSPKATLSKAKANLAKARSMRFEQTTIGAAPGDLQASGDVTRSGDVDVTLRRTNGRIRGWVGTVRFRAVSGRVYIRGDAAYWNDAGLPSYADRWYRAQKKVETSFSQTTDAFKIKKLVACIGAPDATGTLSFGSPTRVGGRRALTIADAGDRPGSRPGTTLVSAGKRPLPLVITSGLVTPGGPTTTCTRPDDTTTSSVMRFTRVDRKLTIRAPKGAATLPG